MNPQLVPISEPVDYRIPLVPNARRFAVGHRIELLLTSDDQPQGRPLFLGYRHPPVGTTPQHRPRHLPALLPVLTATD